MSHSLWRLLRVLTYTNPIKLRPAQKSMYSQFCYMTQYSIISRVPLTYKLSNSAFLDISNEQFCQCPSNKNLCQMALFGASLRPLFTPRINNKKIRIGPAEKKSCLFYSWTNSDFFVVDPSFGHYFIEPYEWKTNIKKYSNGAI